MATATANPLRALAADLRRAEAARGRGEARAKGLLARARNKAVARAVVCGALRWQPVKCRV